MARQTQDHKPFQFGTNPMEMTPFEKSLKAKEVADRKAYTEKYIRGIQGNDGGCKYVNEKDELIAPLNPSKL